MIVYKLYHIREKPSGGDDEKLIGIYTSAQKAEAAIQSHVSLTGFRDHPDGFEIFEHTLDRDGWREGFVTAEEAQESFQDNGNRNEDQAGLSNESTNDLARIREKIRVVDQLKHLAKDEDALSKISVDLYDLVECSEWLLSILPEMRDRTLSDNEIGEFLIKFDVKFVEHVIYHATSLHEGIAEILDELARRNPD